MVYIPENWNIWARLGAKTILVILFAAYIVKKDFPLKSLPVIGKYFK